MNPEQSILLHALAQPSPPERDAYLDHACAGDPRLRHAVDALLLAHQRATGLLDPRPPAPLDDTLPLPLPHDQPPATTIGPYRLLEQLGGGGMGVVYRAEQLRPVRRTVALKIIKPGMDTGQVIARFEAERQALTMMDHPGIAKVLDAGTTPAGRPYFVIELVHGTPITDYCDRARLTTRQRLELFVQVCHAVQHAHQKGITHRDLKPDNVLVTRHDDQPAPKIIDFGIAKAAGHALTDRTLCTNHAQLLGTPLYMSPEQADTGGADVDTRSDVYSLGALLYELLTGTTPFDKQRLRDASYDEMRGIIREEDPPRPSARLAALGERAAPTAAHRDTDPKHLAHLVHGDLDWIVMKALEKDRARRYPTANGMAADVQRHLRDEPVQACPPTARYKLGKFARRYRAPLAVAAALVTVLAAAAVVAASLAVRATRAERAASAQRAAALDAQRRESQLRALAEDRGELLRHNLYLTEMNLAGQAALLPGGLGRVRAILAAWNTGHPDLRNWEWYYLTALCHRDLLTIPAHDGTAFCAAWSPDSTRLASAGLDRTVKIWDAATGQHLRTLDAHTDQVLALAWSPDGTRLAAAGYRNGEHNALKVFDAATGQPLLTIPLPPGFVEGLAWDPGGTRLAAACYWGGNDDPVKIWDTDGQLLASVGDRADRLNTIAWSPDGRLLAWAGDNGAISLWDVDRRQRLHRLRGHTSPVHTVAWNRDGSRLASSANAASGGGVKIWDPLAGRETLSLPSGFGPLRWSPDGHRLAAAGPDHTLLLHDATPGYTLDRTTRPTTTPTTR